MLTIGRRQSVLSIITYGLEFVQLVFAQTLGAEVGHAKTKPEQDQGYQSRDNEFLVGGNDPSRSEEFGV